MPPEEDKTPKPSLRDTERKRLMESERLDTLRDRLYARGSEVEKNIVRHDLGSEAPIGDIKTASIGAIEEEVYSPPAEEEATETRPSLVATYTNIPMPHTMPHKSFRKTLAIAGILFFIVALGIAGVFLFSGNNTISGNNISIDVNGPGAVGGGDAMDLQVTIANQNALPIESATLIIEYPKGTQSIAESGKELFTDRLQLNNIDPNEVVNVPIRVLMFGEQNDTKNIKVSVEYRVRGSNATFYKEALPFEFKIDTSPIVVNVNTVKSIPSGQEVQIELVVISNTQEPLSGLVLRASYPQGFDFTSSVPDTAAGQDTWKLKTLKPTEEQKIVIKGVLTGKENIENQFDYVVGVANENDSYDISSPLAKRESIIKIERPFLDVDVVINGSSEGTVVVDPNAVTNVEVQFMNTLDTAVYDGVISVALSGNAVDEISVSSPDGFYDSSENTLTWDSIDAEQLRELIPGDKNTVSFNVQPDKDTNKTPEIKVLVTIAGNRVGEDRVPERVVGTISRTIKVSSIAKFTSAALYSDGPYQNSGPVPPIAEKTTQYTFLLSMKNGTNPVTGAEVTAVMPQYMTWLDITTDKDAVSYNSANRMMKWNIGELKANEYKEVWVQVALKPSLSQVGDAPTILETQRYKATDRFTGTVVRSEAPALTTSLLKDPDTKLRDGRVSEK